MTNKYKEPLNVSYTLTISIYSFFLITTLKNHRHHLCRLSKHNKFTYLSNRKAKITVMKIESMFPRLMAIRSSTQTCLPQPTHEFPRFLKFLQGSQSHENLVTQRRMPSLMSNLIPNQVVPLTSFNCVPRSCCTTREIWSMTYQAIEICLISVSPELFLLSGTTGHLETSTIALSHPIEIVVP